MYYCEGGSQQRCGEGGGGGGGGCEVHLTNGRPDGGWSRSDGSSSLRRRRLAQELTRLRTQLVSPFSVALLVIKM